MEQIATKQEQQRTNVRKLAAERQGAHQGKTRGFVNLIFQSHQGATEGARVEALEVLDLFAHADAVDGEA